MINTVNTTPTSPSNYKQGIIDYYSEAGMDYEPWSRRFNMHFGYFRLGVNPFNREAMLDEMNNQALSRLQLSLNKANTLLDLGCGVGASGRFIVSNTELVTVIGATIVPWQVKKAKELSTDREFQERLTFELMDYCKLPLANQSIDGAYALESSCYDKGKDKRRFLEESFRILKPGARLVVADGFTKGEKHTRLFNFLYRKVCKGWMLDDFAGVDVFVKAMRDIGYEDIQVQDASWRVALSVMYVPWVSLKYFFSKIFLNKSDMKIEMGHFVAPVFGMLMGLHRSQYGYHIISARKPIKQDRQ